MEIGLSSVKGGRKAQMMTAAVLLMFVLMLAELFAFLTLNSSYNQLNQNAEISQGTSGLISSLQLSSQGFADQSLQKSIQVLASYEYNASMRKGNFISNFSYYVSNLMISGIIPNESAAAGNSIAQQMQGLTLKSYNSSIIKSYGLVGVLVVNETRPYIYQASPYTISVKYVENVYANTSGGTYSYSIPVNATLNLTNEPDLFYAQQGVMRYITFANLNNSVSLLGNTYASNGSLYNFAYGTANIVASGAGNCPTSFGPGQSNSIILVTQNAIGITSSGCANGFGGIITAGNTISGAPTVPYLRYPANVNLQQIIKSGSSLLLYGPGLGSFNIEPLRNAVANGYYFASTASASYIQRAAGQLGQSSSQGIFTASGYNRQVAQFSGQSSYITIPASSSLDFGGSSFTVSGWYYQSVAANHPIFAQRSSCGTADIQLYTQLATFINGGGTTYVLYDTNNGFSPNTWYYVAATYNGNLFTYYVNGAPANSMSASGSLPGTSVQGNIGTETCGYFQGDLSNMQFYNTSLSAAQIAAQYREGIEGLPQNNAGLVGWWPLNGNANDYSGMNNQGTGSGVPYTLAPSGVPTLSTAQFNGASSYVSTGTSGFPTGSSARSQFFWIYPTIGGSYYIAGYGTYGTSKEMSYLLNSGNYLAFIGDGDDFQPSSLAITPNEWNLVGYSYSAGATSVTVFVNGQSQTGSLNGGAALNTVIGSSCIGCATGVSYFPGYIADAQTYNTALSASQATQIYEAGMEGAPVTGAGLVGWWPLNGNANDYSQNGNVGTPVNVLFSQSLGGITDGITGSNYNNMYPLPGVLSCYNIQGCFNASQHNVWLSSYPVASENFLQAAQFNGQSSYIVTGTSGLPLGSSPRSAFAWVYFNYEPSAQNFIFAYGNYGSCCTSQTSGLVTSASGNLIMLGYNNNFKSSFTVPLNSWHFVGYTYASNSLSATVYLDGQSQTGTLSGGVPLNTALASINASTIGVQPGTGGGSGHFCSCLITDVQVYNTALSSTQANALYQEGMAGIPVLPSNIVGWWPLNGNANDYSGNRNDGVSDQNVAYPYVSSNQSNLASIWQYLGFGVAPK